MHEKRYRPRFTRDVQSSLIRNRSNGNSEVNIKIKITVDKKHACAICSEKKKKRKYDINVANYLETAEYLSTTLANTQIEQPAVRFKDEMS